MARSRVIRDPVYGYISLADELSGVVDHPLFQRLRRISQTSLSNTVYPGASGTRFEHALGAMHLAQRAWRSAWRNAYPLDTQGEFILAVREALPSAGGSTNQSMSRFAREIELAIGCVALLHDVGHPPFSHVLEDYFDDRLESRAALLPADPVPTVPSMSVPQGLAFHERVGLHISQELVQQAPQELRPLILTILHEEDEFSWAGALHSIVAGEVDCDRLDYLMRDSLKAGTEFGAIDYERLVDSLELHGGEGKFRIAPGVRARSAVESLLVQRSQYYRWVVYHPRVVAANTALRRACELTSAAASSDIAVGEKTLGQLFGPLLPNLDYVNARFEDLSATLSGYGLEAGSSPQLSFPDATQSRFLQRRGDDMRSGVDDSSISEMLKASSLLASALLESAVPADVKPMLSRLVTFSRAAIFRSKNYVPAWKTADEFEVYVRRIEGFLPGITEVAFEVFTSVIEAASGSYREAVASYWELLQRQLTLDPIGAVNAIFADVLSSEHWSSRLASQLNESRRDLKSTPGSWEIVYTRFSPLHGGEDQFAEMFRGDEAVPVSKVSPLVAALDAVERSRPKVHVLFFFDHPNVAAGGPEEAREAREWLASTFLNALPGFLKTAWPVRLEETFGEQGAAIGREIDA